MATIELRYGLITQWTTDLTDLLTALSRDATDITDIAFCLKSKRTASDEDAEVFWTLLNNPSNISLDTGTSIVTFTLDSALYTNLRVGRHYFLAVGIKFTGDTQFLELEETNNRDIIKITQDTIRG